MRGGCRSDPSRAQQAHAAVNGPLPKPSQGISRASQVMTHSAFQWRTCRSERFCAANWRKALLPTAPSRCETPARAMLLSFFAFPGAATALATRAVPAQAVPSFLDLLTTVGSTGSLRSPHRRAEIFGRLPRPASVTAIPTLRLRAPAVCEMIIVARLWAPV